jgi:hypothetical protein
VLIFWLSRHKYLDGGICSPLYNTAPPVSRKVHASSIQPSLRSLPASDSDLPEASDPSARPGTVDLKLDTAACTRHQVPNFLRCCCCSIMPSQPVSRHKLVTPMWLLRLPSCWWYTSRCKRSGFSTLGYCKRTAAI